MNNKRNNQWIKKIMILCNFMILCSGVISCATTRNAKSEKGCLKIMVFDDKEKPVNDFEIICQKKEYEIKGYTDFRGMVCFDEIPFGDYELNGMKSGYGKVENRKISFTNQSNVIFCQVQGIFSLFEKVETAFLNKDFEKGLSFFDDIYVEENTAISGARTFYTATAYFNQNEMEKALNEINSLRQMNCAGFDEPCNRLEKMIFEKTKEEIYEDEEVMD